jgi:PKD repeat protein
LPVVSFAVKPLVCASEDLSLQNLSSISSGSVQYHWDFGNGFQSALASPAYSYSVPGIYTIQLNVVSNSGCTVARSDSVRVNPNPSAAFTLNDICEMQSASFSNQSSISDPVPLLYSWDFGNGIRDTVTNPLVAFSEAGNFAVKLVVTAAGCADSVSHNIKVNPLPKALFSGSGVCSNAPVNFANNSSIASGSIATWQWNFGDSAVSAQKNPSHAYASPGAYMVSLVARSQAGCYDTTQSLVYANPKPVVDFSGRDACDGAPILFTDRTTISSGQPGTLGLEFRRCHFQHGQEPG